VLPVVSIPVWAVANARATRRLGRAAVNFYAGPPTHGGADGALTLPPRPTPRTRRLVIGTAVPLALGLGVLFALLPIGRYHHGLRWVGFGLAELALVLTFARLIRLTGARADSSSWPQRESGAWSTPLGASTDDRSDTEEVEFRLKQGVSVIDSEVETRTGRCATHGTVEATREVPRLQFPYAVNVVRRSIARRRPFRCPSCQEEVATS
jgi:hypothetical protein